MNRIVDLAAKGDPLAVGTDGIGADRSFDVGDLRHRAAGGGDGVEVVVAAIEVRLENAIRGEVDPRAVGTPGDVALVEFAAGELLRLRGFSAVERIGNVDGPDVRGARGVAIGGGGEASRGPLVIRRGSAPARVATDQMAVL